MVIRWACFGNCNIMELSEAVLEGLKVAGSSSVSDELFSSLLSRAFSVSQTSIDEGTVDIV